MCVAAALPVDYHFGAHVNKLERAHCLRETRGSETNEKTGSAAATHTHNAGTTGFIRLHLESYFLAIITEAEEHKASSHSLTFVGFHVQLAYILISIWIILYKMLQCLAFN